jgi:hypothetical protein
MNQMGHTTPHLALSLYVQAMQRRDGERDRLRALVDGHGALLLDERRSGTPPGAVDPSSMPAKQGGQPPAALGQAAVDLL